MKSNARKASANSFALLWVRWFMVVSVANWLLITKSDSASCHYPLSVPQADTCLILLHIDYSASGTGWMFGSFMLL